MTKYVSPSLTATIGGKPPSANAVSSERRRSRLNELARLSVPRSASSGISRTPRYRRPTGFSRRSTSSSSSRRSRARPLGPFISRPSVQPACVRTRPALAGPELGPTTRRSHLAGMTFAAWARSIVAVRALPAPTWTRRVNGRGGRNERQGGREAHARRAEERRPAPEEGRALHARRACRSRSCRARRGAALEPRRARALGPRCGRAARRGLAEPRGGARPDPVRAHARLAVHLLPRLRRLDGP